MSHIHSLTIRKTGSAGFTLIELLIVLAIVAILAAVALPSYSEYVKRSRVVEATSGMAARQAQMEQYFQDNLKYPTTATSGCTALLGTSFDFSCTGMADTTYTLQAVGKGTMAGIKYTVNQAGTKATVISGTANWPSSSSCWVTNKAGAC